MSTEYFSDDSRQTTTKGITEKRGRSIKKKKKKKKKKKTESRKEVSCGQKDSSSHVKRSQDKIIV
jgi:hypothetical protein